MNRLPQLPVWWAIWAAMQTGVCVFYFVLSGSQPAPATPPASAASSLWYVALGPLLLSIAVRVLLVVWAPAAHVAFALFILGMSLAESVVLIGIFLAPAHQLELFILSSLGILQFIPWYAGRFPDS